MKLLKAFSKAFLLLTVCFSIVFLGIWSIHNPNYGLPILSMVLLTFLTIGFYND